MSTVKSVKALLLSFVIFLVSCADDEPASVFADILTKPPYAELTDSIQKDPGRSDLYFRRAVLLNQNNFPEPALADFKKAWSLDKQEDYAVGVANLLLAKNKHEAIDFINDALKNLPDNILLQMSLAHAYDELGKTDEALAVCNDIVKKQPAFASALILQSDLLQKKGDTEAAAISMENALRAAPGNREIANKLAYLYAENKNPKVLSLTDSLIVKDSLKIYPEPSYIKGIYYSNTGEKEKAIQAFNETIKLSYNYLNAYIEKGKIYFDQKKIAEALKTFELANTISPAFPDAYYWIGRCQEAKGQKEDAKLSYEKAYSLDKTFTEAKEAADKIR
jgi:tetratricopeptide (TPR) repeat protein